MKQEEALNASPSRYRSIFDAINDAIFLHDPETGAILEINAKMTEMYGYTPDEAHRMTVGDLSSGVPPYDQEGAVGHVRAAAEGGGAVFEWQAKDKSGRLFWAEVSLKPALIDGRSLVVATVRDTTLRKRNEEEIRRLNEELEEMVRRRTEAQSVTVAKLEEQRELLQAIIDNIPVIITVWRPYRKLVMVNREFERLSGWSREEAMSMDIISSSFPDPAYRKEIIEQVSKAEPGWGEFVWTTRSGRDLTISWAAVNLSDGSRIGIGIDMTERRKMEKDMQRLAVAIDQAGEGVVLFSSGWVVEYVNPAFEHISGLSREEIIGKDARALDESITSGFDSEHVIGVVSRGETWRGNIVTKMKTGNHRNVHLTISPVRSPSGEIMNYASLIRDITQEAKLQQMVIQSQKMEAIGSLAGGIAHDLKNIFTPILINAEIALEDTGRDHPAHPLLEDILSAARMGGDLVRQIMTFARQTSGEKVPVDVSSLVSETLSLLRSTVPATISIRHHFATANSLVLADPTQIRQVLMNLGSNAAYAMKDHGGLLDVSVTCVDMDPEASSRISPDLAPGSYVEIDFSDTGEGMDEETRQHIFEPFFTTKGHGEGTGLGLALVQGIAKGHQGAVSVWSSPGAGSTFSVLLPLHGACSRDGAGLP